MECDETLSGRLRGPAQSGSVLGCLCNSGRTQIYDIQMDCRKSAPFRVAVNDGKIDIREAINRCLLGIKGEKM